MTSVVLPRRRDGSRHLETIKELPQHRCHPWRQCCASYGLGGEYQQGRRLDKCRSFCVTQHDQMLTLGVRDPHAVALDTRHTVRPVDNFEGAIQSPEGDKKRMSLSINRLKPANR